MNTDIIDSKYLKTLTILYVEDEEDIFNLMVPLLSRYCAMLLTARNGAEGMDIFTSQLPDIVITDIHMPIMDGLAMAEQIRVLDRSVPIVAVTAFERVDYLKRAIDANIDRYVMKPVSIKLLFESLIACSHRLRVERHLQESEERFRQFFECSADANIMICDCVIIGCNRAAEQLFRIERDKLVGQHSKQFSPHLQPGGRLSAEALAEKVMEVVKEGYSSFEWIIQRPDGSQLWVDISLSTVVQHGKQVTIGSLRDISARKEAEATLHSITESASDAIIIIDSREQIAFWNPAATALFGYSAPEVVGKKFSELLEPHCVSSLYQPLLNQFLTNDSATPQKRTCELRALPKSGQEITIELSMAVHRYGFEWHVIGIIRDISACKKLEDQLHTSHALLTTLSQQIPGMIYQYRILPDGSSYFPYVSDSIREIYEMTPEEAQKDASKVFTLLHRDDYSGVVASIAESARTLRPWSSEYRVIHAKGTVRWLYGTARPEQLADGSIQWHGFISDITDIKEMEIQLYQTTEAAIALDGMSALICVIDELGTITRTNKSWDRFSVTSKRGKELFGVGSNLFIACQAITDMQCHPNDDVISRIKSVFDGTLPEISMDFCCPFSEGECWFTRKVNAFTAAGKKYAVIVDVDISWRKTAEGNLQKLTRAVDQSPVAIMITNQDGTIEYVNRYYSKISGYRTDEIIGQLPSILKSGQNAPETYRELWATIRNGQVWSGELVNRCKDGSHFIEKATISAIYDNRGVITHFLAVKEDVTEQKRLKVALVQAKKHAVTSMQIVKKQLILQNNTGRRITKEL